jgi:hypothetical protein
VPQFEFQANRGQQLLHCPWPSVKQESQTWGRERNILGEITPRDPARAGTDLYRARGNGFPLLLAPVMITEFPILSP